MEFKWGNEYKKIRMVIILVAPYWNLNGGTNTKKIRMVIILVAPYWNLNTSEKIKGVQVNDDISSSILEFKSIFLMFCSFDYIYISSSILEFKLFFQFVHYSYY